MRHREDDVVVGTWKHALLGECQPTSGAKKRTLGAGAMPTGVHADNIVMAFGATLVMKTKLPGVTKPEKASGVECVVGNTVRPLEIGKVFAEYFPDGGRRI